MKNNLFGTLQKVGQSLMVPVSVLPAAGLLVALGRWLMGDLKIEKGVFVLHYFLGQICFEGGLAIFKQLPVVFAIGVAIGFSGGAGVAGLAAAVGYFTLDEILKVMTASRGLEVAINTGVFGGIIIGLLSAHLYNRFHTTKLHPVFGFFSGKRLVPIVTAASAVVVGLMLGVLWPIVQNGITEFGTWAVDSQFGAAFYAAGKRALIPLGLHHVFYPPFMFQFGSFADAAGKIFTGDSARYFAGDPTAGVFMASEFPIMLFGLPAAALAMVLRAEKNRRKAIAGIMVSAALTSIITGITEPIEFAFIFVAPILYVFHVAAAFCSGLLTNAFDIHLGYTFSASVIDLIVGAFNMKNGINLLIVGPLIGFSYFSVFYFFIGFFNLKTPGRDNGLDEESEKTTENSRKSASSRSEAILTALGSTENIQSLDACITRLRVTVKNADLVKQDVLKSLGAAGILNAGKGNFQIIFGTESDHIKEEIKHLMELMKNKQKSIPLFSPLKGSLVPIEKVPDQTFSGKVLGDGIAILPTEGIVYAPLDAVVAQVFRTNHALALRTYDGAEILIHIGIDTVKMNGEGFKTLVSEGNEVKKGQKLIEFDLELVKSRAPSVITPVVFVNMDSVASVNLTTPEGSLVGNNTVILNYKMKQKNK